LPIADLSSIDELASADGTRAPHLGAHELFVITKSLNHQSVNKSAIGNQK